MAWHFIPLFFLNGALASSKITNVGFKGTSDPNEISIQADGPITYEKIENVPDKQVILELKGAQITKDLARKIDTSSFDSKVSLISPYQVEGKEDRVRVVVQLREMANIEASQDGNTILLKIPGTETQQASAGNLDQPPEGEKTPNNSTAGSTAAASTESASTDSSATPPAPPAESSSAPSTTGSESVSSASSTEIASSDTTKKSDLETFTTTKETKKFIGRPVTLQIRDGDIGDVLRLISEASGFNIVMGEEVRGKLNLSLVDVPWIKLWIL